jgi:hypothetical protein
MLFAPLIMRYLHPENILMKGPTEQNCPHEEDQQSASFSETSCSLLKTTVMEHRASSEAWKTNTCNSFE